MNVSIAHPTDRPNFCRLYLGDDLTIWFSYETPIAYAYPGEGRVVRENDWSNTTGRHLNEVDGGRKSARIPGDEFEARLSALTDRLQFAAVTA